MLVHSNRSQQRPVGRPSRLQGPNLCRASLRYPGRQHYLQPARPSAKASGSQAAPTHISCFQGNSTYQAATYHSDTCTITASQAGNAPWRPATTLPNVTLNLPTPWACQRSVGLVAGRAGRERWDCAASMLNQRCAQQPNTCKAVGLSPAS